MKNTFFVFLCSLINVSQAQVFNIVNYGAVGDNLTLNTTFIQEAIDACHAAGGGTVLVPPGDFLTGTIILKTNVTLKVDSAATLHGSQFMTDYPVFQQPIRTYTDFYTQRSLILAIEDTNVAIVGKGTIDFHGLNSAFILDSDNKPYGIRFLSCKNVLYQDVTLRNSGFWMMHNLNIDGLTIDGIVIYNHGPGNNDGINIDGSKNVLVKNCTVDANNDPLVMKATGPFNCENIEVFNCTFATLKRAIKIGTETTGGFKDVHVHNCLVKKSVVPFGNAADCGINLSIVDGGFIENVLIENINITAVNTPIFIRLGNRGRKHEASAPIPPVGSVQGITLQNINIEAQSNITSSITGIPGYSPDLITLKNIEITIPGGMPFIPSAFIVPEEIDGKPEHNMFGDTLPSYGFFIRHVDRVYMENVCVNYQEPDGRYPLFIEDGETNMEVQLDSFPGAGFCVQSMKYTGITQNIEEGYHLYPNPAEREFFFYYDGSTDALAHLYDSFGNTVFTAPVSSGRNRLDSSQFPRGLYLLKVEGSEIVQKFLLH